MSIALDLGTFRFRSLRRIGENLLSRQDRAGYCVLPALASYEQLLRNGGVEFARCDDSLILMGEGSDDFAALFQLDFIPVVPNGSIPTNDPLSRQVLAAIVDAMLPDPVAPGETCYVTPPSGSEHSEERKTTEEFFGRLIRLRGFTPKVMPAGMAVVLADLVDTGFTGIGMSFGASSCDAVLAWRGVEVATAHIAKGGNWIDHTLANESDRYIWSPSGERLLDVEGAAKSKVDFRGSLLEPSARSDQLLATLYRDLIATLLQKAARDFSVAPRLNEIRRPIPVVCAGGPTQIDGFLDLLASALTSVALPVEVNEVRHTASGDFAVARGSLIAAELELQPQRQAA
ncbi:MAG: hypothetical protein CMJ78_26505 [Planctomycetaceae bacterium]|nr:hypothetical protein [Planctomycetaceae bacterium]